VIAVQYRFRLVNVFTVGNDPFSGNPLCVFEDGRGLSDQAMQGLALQFNLSETTFILPSDAADAKVRIFTPMFEMPFAGHPTLGSAHVVRSLRDGRDVLRLEMRAGTVPVTFDADRYSLQAQEPRTRPVEATRAELAGMLSIAEEEITGAPLWVDTGSEQLLVKVTSQRVVDRCRPAVAALERYARVGDDRFLVYVFADSGDGQVTARFFFKRGSTVVEDPATGSACANLGGFLLASAAPLPLTRHIDQGRAVRRPSQLGLRVDTDRRIFASGSVMEIGRGVIDLPS
jgi:PhzF family phenazine biosynthesis protein